MSALKLTTPKTDPVERARAIVEGETPKPSGRARAKRREIVGVCMAENIGFLSHYLTTGDSEGATYTAGRLSTLMGEMKTLEGWDWSFPPEHFIRNDADPILSLIETCRTGWHETYSAELDEADRLPTEAERDALRSAAADRQQARLQDVLDTSPTTFSGLAALGRFLVEMEEETNTADDGREFLDILATAIEGFASRGAQT